MGQSTKTGDQTVEQLAVSSFFTCSTFYLLGVLAVYDYKSMDL